jgi:hypothetical protein
MVVAMGFALGLLLVWSSSALAASQPSIEGVSVRNVSTNDAILEATVNPKDLSGFGADLQFQVVTNTSEYLPEIVCPTRNPPGWDGCAGALVPAALPIGGVEKAAKGESVHLDLASAGMTLKPGTTYHYRLLAATAVVTEDVLQWEGPPAYSADQTFTTPAAQAPSIEKQSASHVTSTDATLEATINPEDVERGAHYQFQLVANPNEYLSEFACPAEWVHTFQCNLGRLDSTVEGLPIGDTDGGVGGQAVSLDLAHAGVTLKPGTTYHYRVIAARIALSEDGFDWAGTLVEGADQTFTTPAGGPPSEVTSEPAEATPTGFKLKGKLNPDGLPSTYYFHYWPVRECSEDPPDCGPNTAVVGPLTGDAQREVPPIEVTGLTRGETYGYELIAGNADGTVRGNELQFTVEETGAPSEVETGAAEVAPNGVELKGKLNPHGLPTSYYFEYASDTCDEGCTPMKTAVVGPLTGDAQREVPAVEVTGLNVGERYWYRLVAHNADGAEGGDFLFFTAEMASEPTEVRTEVAEMTPDGFRLKGELDPGDLPTTYYFIYKDTGVECEDLEGCGPSTPMGGPLTGDTREEVPAFEVTGLEPGKTYRYWMIARNAKGTVRSNEVSFTTSSFDAGQLDIVAPSTTTSGPSQSGASAGASAGSGGSSSMSAVTPLGSPLGEQLTKFETPLTNTQKLAKALKACKKKSRGEQVACEKQAHRHFGKTAKKGKKKQR